MIQTTVQVSGMACSMCEAHVNDAVRNALNIQKVTSSHGKGETVILTEQQVEEQAVRDALADTGYDVTAVASHPYKKKGLFGFRKG